MNTESFPCINTPSLRKDRLSSTVKIYPSPRSHPRLHPGSVQNPYRSPHFDTDRIRSSKQYKFIFETSEASRKACEITYFRTVSLHDGENTGLAKKTTMCFQPNISAPTEPIFFYPGSLKRLHNWLEFEPR